MYEKCQNSLVNELMWIHLFFIPFFNWGFGKRDFVGNREKRGVFDAFTKATSHKCSLAHCFFARSVRGFNVCFNYYFRFFFNNLRALASVLSVSATGHRQCKVNYFLFIVILIISTRPLSFCHIPTPPVPLSSRCIHHFYAPHHSD